MKEYTTKYTDNINDRNWGRNNAMFISNLVRASVFSRFQTVRQGFSPTGTFDTAAPHALVGLSFENKEYYCLIKNSHQKVKYKSKVASQTVAEYLIKKQIMNQSNFKQFKTKVYILVKHVRNQESVQVFQDGSINFLDNADPRDFQDSNSELFNYDYYESLLHNNIVHCYARLH